jgi:hypothetical protein
VVWRFLHGAVTSEFPTVIEAANTVVLDTAKHERGAAMHAQFFENADFAATVAKGDQILAEEPHIEWRPVRHGKLRGRTGRQPVAAHHAAHRHAGTDTSQQFVFGCSDHGVAPEV